MFQRTILLAAVAAMSMIVVSGVAQMLPGRDGGGGFPGADQVGGLAEIQAKIRASDEEWKVIGPKLRKVIAAYAAVEAGIEEPSSSGTGGSGSMPGGRGGRGGPGGGPPGGPGNDSFANPGDGGPFGRGGPGPAGFGRGGPGPDGFSPGGPGPDGLGPDGFGPGGLGPGGFGRGGPGPGGGPPGFGGSNNAVTQKLVELRTTLADPNGTSEQIKEKITAVRNARQKAKAELAAARKDLLELLTLEQEAVLVSLDCLD